MEKRARQIETVEKWRRLVRHCRVHGYFENSINLAPPPPAVLLHIPFFSSSISQPRHAHRSPGRAMKFPRRPNLSLFPRRSGPGPDIPQAFPKASIVTLVLLIWPGSTFYPLCPPIFLSAFITYHFLRFLRVDHKTRSRLSRKDQPKVRKRAK